MGSAGAYNVTVTGTSGSVHRSETISYTVQDFRISASSIGSVVAGSTGTSTITLTSQNSFNGSITLTVSTGSNGPIVSLSSSSVLVSGVINGTSTLTVETAGVTPGSYQIGVNATFTDLLGHQLLHPMTVSVLVTPAPALRTPTSALVTSGSNLRFSVNVTDSDPSRTVTLTASGLPAGATFNTALGSGTFSGVFSWIPSDSQASHDYNVTFTADDGHGGVAVSQMTIHVAAKSQAAPLFSASQYWFLGLAGFGVAVMSPLLIRVIKRTVKRGKIISATMYRESQ